MKLSPLVVRVILFKTSVLKVGSLCHVNFKKIFEATIVTYGNKLIISHDIDRYAAKRV